MAWATSIVAAIVIGVAVRNALVDETATPDRIRLGTQLGGELARREVLRYRAREGRWPTDLAAVSLDGMALELTVSGDRFVISGPDGAGGRLRFEGSVDDVPPSVPAGTETPRDRP